MLALTFCLGTGSAFMWPAWQASMSGLVEPDEVEAAATLNNLSYNVAAIVGPALGGVLFNWIGAGALFLVNAISFVGLLSVYWAWWQERLPSTATRTPFIDSLKAGLCLRARLQPLPQHPAQCLHRVLRHHRLRRPAAGVRARRAAHEFERVRHADGQPRRRRGAGRVHPAQPAHPVRQDAPAGRRAAGLRRHADHACRSPARWRC